MPTPVFIVCAQSSIIDKSRNLLSLINVIEGFRLVVHADPPEPGSTETTAMQPRLESVEKLPNLPLSFSVNAVWMREEKEEPGSNYAYRILLHPPGLPPVEVPTTDLIRLDKRFLRVSFHFALGQIWPHSGMLWVEVMISPAGSDIWQSQRFPIPYEVDYRSPRALEQPEDSN